MAFIRLLIIYWVIATLLIIVNPNINWGSIAITWIVANCLDAHSTWLCCKTGKGSEGNPIFRWFFEKIGVLPSLILIKPLFTILFLYMVYVNQVSGNIMLACSIIITSIAINNYRIATNSRDKYMPKNPLNDEF